MTLNASSVIELAVTALVAKEFPIEDTRPEVKTGDWAVGEAENWLTQIALDGRTLGYRLEHDGQVYPVLE